MELVLLLEEPSAKAFLDEFLPRILPPEITFRTIPHNGKSDLQKSLPRKLRGWRNPNARFVVLHDKDSNDCQHLKQTLRDICVAARPDLHPLIRIACHELEAWYLGDFDALSGAFPGFNAEQFRGRAKYRDVDALANAAQELSSLVPAYQKVSGSRELGKAIGTGDSNTSHSFRIFVQGIKQLVA
jgi:hypothetical protein